MKTDDAEDDDRDTYEVALKTMTVTLKMKTCTLKTKAVAPLQCSIIVQCSIAVLNCSDPS
jgi:hypothetical protein